jgi:hypothetical protein
LVALDALLTLRALDALDALNALRADCPRNALRAGLTLRASIADRPLLTLDALRAGDA